MSQLETISILVAEDHHITRTGLRLTLQQRPEFRVVGEVADGRSAVSMALDLHPQVVLMDIGLPEIDGIEATWQIKSALPASRVIMLTSHESDEDILAALGVGADGYCYKDVSVEQLAEAIQSVTHGNSWLDPRIAQRVGTPYKSSQNTSQNTSRKGQSDANLHFHNLEEREMDILYLIKRGHGAVSIAGQLGLGVESVRLHMCNIMEKLSPDAGESARFLNDLPFDGNTSKNQFPPRSIIKKQEAIGELEVGSRFADRYIIEELMATGGMGHLYRARHIHMNRVVAIKVLSAELASDRRIIRRFQEESKAACTLSHPNVVAIYDFGVTDSGRAFLVMDYVKGRALDEIIETEGYLSLGRFLRMFIQICDGLNVAHSNGIVHCDLKPSNIMVVRDEEGRDVPKLVDFGLARVLPPEDNLQLQLTDSFEVSGSPMYMSPEQCTGHKLDVRSDIYSLGCVMYEALSGVTVFTGNTPFELFAKHLQELPQPFSVVCPERSIPPSLEAIIMKTLAKEPEQRYSSVRDLKHALESIWFRLEVA